MIKQDEREQSTSKVKLALAATVALAAVGGAVWAVAGNHADKKPTVEIPQQFAVDNLKKMEPGPGMWDQMRELRDRKDLTDEQRDQIRDNMRSVMEARFKERIDEYYSAKGEDKKKILDKHIDEMQKFREQMEARRNQEGNQAGGPPGGDRPRGDGDRGQGGRGGPGGGSREQRMTRTQSRNPDQMAKRMAYMAAVNERMKERGMQPFGGGGPRGPRG